MSINEQMEIKEGHAEILLQKGFTEYQILDNDLVELYARLLDNDTPADAMADLLQMVECPFDHENCDICNAKLIVEDED